MTSQKKKNLNLKWTHTIHSHIIITVQWKCIHNICKYTTGQASQKINYWNFNKFFRFIFFSKKHVLYDYPHFHTFPLSQNKTFTRNFCLAFVQINTTDEKSKLCRLHNHFTIMFFGKRKIIRKYITRQKRNDNHNNEFKIFASWTENSLIVLPVSLLL